MDKLRKDLGVIGEIPPHYTLNVKDMTLVRHHTWLGATKRLWHREDRLKTVVVIEDIVDEAIQHLPRELDLLYLLKGAHRGLLNLKQTYANDEDMRDRLEQCLRRVENSCTRFERYLIGSIEEISTLVETELHTTVDEHEYDGVRLVRQTPVTSPPSQTPQESHHATPKHTSPTHLSPKHATPKETPPPTPPSTPQLRSPEKSPRYRLDVEEEEEKEFSLGDSYEEGIFTPSFGLYPFFTSNFFLMTPFNTHFQRKFHIPPPPSSHLISISPHPLPISSRPIPPINHRPSSLPEVD